MPLRRRLTLALLLGSLVIAAMTWWSGVDRGVLLGAAVGSGVAWAGWLVVIAVLAHGDEASPSREPEPAAPGHLEVGHVAAAIFVTAVAAHWVLGYHAEGMFFGDEATAFRVPDMPHGLWYIADFGMPSLLFRACVLAAEVVGTPILQAVQLAGLAALSGGVVWIASRRAAGLWPFLALLLAVVDPVVSLGLLRMVAVYRPYAVFIPLVTVAMALATTTARGRRIAVVLVGLAAMDNPLTWTVLPGLVIASPAPERKELGAATLVLGAAIAPRAGVAAWSRDLVPATFQESAWWVWWWATSAVAAAAAWLHRPLRPAVAGALGGGVACVAAAYLGVVPFGARVVLYVVPATLALAAAGIAGVLRRVGAPDRFSDLVAIGISVVCLRHMAMVADASDLEVYERRLLDGVPLEAVAVALAVVAIAHAFGAGSWPSRAFAAVLATTLALAVPSFLSASWLILAQHRLTMQIARPARAATTLTVTPFFRPMLAGAELPLVQENPVTLRLYDMRKRVFDAPEGPASCQDPGPVVHAGMVIGGGHLPTKPEAATWIVAPPPPDLVRELPYAWTCPGTPPLTAPGATPGTP